MGVFDACEAGIVTASGAEKGNARHYELKKNGIMRFGLTAELRRLNLCAAGRELLAGLAVDRLEIGALEQMLGAGFFL
jgi:hypothetical protein